MLGLNDCNFIKTNGWIMDHDWELYSCLLGEPFFIDGLLCYWDGAHVSICSWPVERFTLNEDMRERLFGVVYECVKQFDPMVIEVWGPHKLSLDPILPSTFRKFAVSPANPYNINLQIRYAEYRMPQNKNYRNAIKAEKAGLHCKIEKSVDFTWQHFRLMEELLNRRDLGTFQRTYSILAPVITRSSKSTMFHVYKGEELVGFFLVREALKDIAIGTWANYKKGSLHPSDFLHRKVIEHYQKSGIPIFDMGYSIHSNLLRYKLRWGTNVNNGSFYDYAYVRNGYRLLSKYWHWWVRELFYPILQECLRPS